jgi:hypothetical protein
MDTLHEELDRSFGNGPPIGSVESRVTAGRRARRRRRVAGGAAGVAAAAVLVTGWYAVSPGSSQDSGRLAGDPATSTTSTPSDTTDGGAGDPVVAPWPRGELVRYVHGQLDVRPGVTVHERIRNPYGYRTPRLSDALDVTWHGHRQWLIIERLPKPLGTSSSSSTPSDGWASFADYVADQVHADGSGWPDTFELDAGGDVVPTPGTRVFDRTDDPQLGPGFAPADATTGAAVVSVPGEQGNLFVVWRVVDGALDVVTTPPGDIVGATFNELLSGARARYASGKGLR